jgi:hypothetical protein
MLNRMSRPSIRGFAYHRSFGERLARSDKDTESPRGSEESAFGPDRRFPQHLARRQQPAEPHTAYNPRRAKLARGLVKGVPPDIYRKCYKRLV